jgi:large subunit ribosomal protein L28
MSRRCQITGAVPSLGRKIIRSGKSKKSGGIGMHVTANTPRKRLYVPELGRHVSLRLTARALKTISKKGAYATLKRAGLV